MSLFSNLQISRVTESMLIKRQDAQGYIRRCADELTDLTIEKKRTITQRLTDYLGSDSHSIQMDIEDDTETSTFQMCARMVVCNDDAFVRFSRELVQKLENALTSGKAPTGYILVLSGTTGDDNKRFVCLMKAELHDGFSTEAELNDATELSVGMKHTKHMFLTPTQKLHKICIFVENERPADPDASQRYAEDFKAIVFDHQLTRASVAGMAQYFYKGFMGCTVARISKKLTGDFYSITQSRIYSLPIPTKDKVELCTTLVSYLQDSQRSTLNVAEYAAYLPEPYRNAYIMEMGDKHFPDNDVVIDRDVVAGKLNKRNLTFDSKVSLTAPSSGFENLVEILSTDDEYTIIKVRGNPTEKNSTIKSPKETSQ